ncbi:MAG: transcription antiterminator, partial [Clostridiales bacterium]|nr:transcription antiterminator [Clostridiales bacterium]
RTTHLLTNTIFYYETQMKLGGQWRMVRKITFPGLVFFSADEEIRLLDSLKEILGLPGFVRIGRDITLLSDEEVQFLEEIGEEDHVMAMSTGSIEGARLRILSGPLGELDCSKVEKIDRHKRRAYLKADLFGSVNRVPVGLEVKKKTS